MSHGTLVYVLHAHTVHPAPLVFPISPEMEFLVSYDGFTLVWKDTRATGNTLDFFHFTAEIASIAEGTRMLIFQQGLFSLTSTL